MYCTHIQTKELICWTIDEEWFQQYNQKPQQYCFSTDESISVELEDDQVLKMKEVFQQYEFEDYDSEEEELSKIVRSMINYADQEAELDKLFSQ